MRKLVLSVVAVFALGFIAARATRSVRFIEGMMNIEWKQKGSQPVVITVYDATTSPEWGPIVEDAVHLWDASDAFQLQYVRLTSETFPVTPNTVRVVERSPGNQPPAQTYFTPNAQGIVDNAGVRLPTLDIYTGTDPSYQLFQMQRLIRHELGHVLTVDHHQIAWSQVMPWGGGAEPDCAMANGNQVTAFDLGLICQRYSCR